MDFIRETILVPVGNELVSVRVSEFDSEIESLLNGYTVASSSDGEDSNNDVSGGDSNDDDDGNENDGGSENNFGEQVAIGGISDDDLVARLTNVLDLSHTPPTKTKTKPNTKSSRYHNAVGGGVNAVAGVM
ncbi:hypothetical protein Tco_1542898, partial [Tanacetum coccineum]